MTVYNSLLKRLILPVGDKLFGGNYLKYISDWKQYDGLSEKELKTIQEKKLKKLLDYAIKNVSFYKSLNINGSLSSFPILTKSLLRKHTENLISKEYKIQSLDKNHSSGSTGMQSFTFMTPDHKFYLRALQTHWWTWSGYTIGDNLLQFGISQERSLIKKLKDIFYRCIYVKAFGLSETELASISDKIRSKKSVYIAGYPSVINQLAEICLKKNIHPKGVKGIICFGDKLFNHYKKNIKNAFGEGFNIIDTYGCAEGLLMASKYDLDYYYIMSPHVYIEIVNDDGILVNDGEMGHVLVTCLTNYAMPLIRYKLGDLAIKLPKEDYPKNRLLNYPLLKQVVGRETDIVKTTKGITLNVHSFTGVIEYFPEIKQYKIIQNELDAIIIEYIVDYSNDFNIEVIEKIKTKLNKLTDNCLTMTFKEVNIIKPTHSGKPQIIESNLKTV